MSTQTPDSFSDGFEWTELDRRAVDTARLLAADAVQQVGNGHPGTAMSLAPDRGGDLRAHIARHGDAAAA
jgi:transketolase